MDRLLDNVNALCKAYMTKFYSGRYNVRIGGEYKTGCALKIIQEFQQMLAAREELKTSSGTALVVVKMNAVNDHFTPPTKENKRNKKWNEDGQSAHARSSGYIDGQKVEINKRLDD